MSKARTRAASFAGTVVDGYILTSDAVGVGSWKLSASSPTITSFQYSDGATATAEDVLGGVITITGTGFDSILAGMSVNVGVTFGGTTATSISVNAGKTIITATAPAKPAGTVTMKVTNASGLSVERDFIYDPLPTLTTGAGTLGTFIDGIYTTSSTGTLLAPVFAGPAEGGVAVTYAQATSASDDTIITTGVQGLYVDSVSGKLIGTLGAGAVATTYPFYGISVDDENQRSIPRLFNIISALNSSALAPDTSTVIAHDTYDIGSDTYIVYTFLTVGTSVITFSASTSNVDVLVVAGGGGGGGQIGGGGGAGGLLTFTSLTLSGAYNVIVGDKGVAQGNTSRGTVGGDSQFEGSTLVKGGGYGGVNGTPTTGGDGGSGGGSGENSAGPHDGGSATPSGQGTDGGASNSVNPYSAGGGGGASTGGTVSNASSGQGGAGGAGTANSYRLGTGVSAVTYAGGGGGGSWGTGGAGGAGGGGEGCDGTSNNATAGDVNTGGGGGGGGKNGSTSGKDGGTGIVVVRYKI